MKILDTPLSQLDLHDGILIAAIHRGAEVIIPNGDTEIHENDRIILLSLLKDRVITESLIKDTGRLSFFRRNR